MQVCYILFQKEGSEAQNLKPSLKLKLIISYDQLG